MIQPFGYQESRNAFIDRAREFTPGSGIPLSEEHVIPESLGARFILKEASCKGCAESTKAFEGSISGTLLQAARRHLGIRKKKRSKKRESMEQGGYPVTVSIEGRETVIRLPLEDHPTLVLLPRITGPGLFMTEHRERLGVTGMWALPLGRPDKVAGPGIQAFNSPSLDTVAFCQLLAKIAHGVAVAAFGPDGFRPLLTQAIRQRHTETSVWAERYEYIGCDPSDYANSKELHFVSLMFHPYNGHEYLIAVIRLFACLGAPVYSVVVGELTPEQRRRGPVAIEFLECMPDKISDPPPQADPS